MNRPWTLACLAIPVLLAACSGDGPSPVPTSAFPSLPPLPTELWPPTPGPEVREASPTSARNLEPGRITEYGLGHCGLLSPVDVDGSLWSPVGSVDARGGPIDTEAELGELVNATLGEVVLVSSERLDFRTTSGIVVVLRRLPGSQTYPLCF